MSTRRISQIMSNKLNVVKQFEDDKQSNKKIVIDPSVIDDIKEDETSSSSNEEDENDNVVINNMVFSTKSANENKLNITKELKNIDEHIDKLAIFKQSLDQTRDRPAVAV